MTETHVTAESMPIVRKGFKVLGQVAFAVIWISAAYMTISVMLDRAQGQPWWVALSLVTLGLGADFWVGAGPVILRSSSKWGLKGWVWIGTVTLVMAIMFSYTNKLAFWVEDGNNRAAIHAVAGVDKLTEERKLVADNPGARVPAAVKAEADAARKAVEAKRAEIAGYPADWPNRTRRAQQELLALEKDSGKLSGEYATAVAVADAKKKISAAQDHDAIVAATPKDDVDPVIQWVMGMAAMLGLAITKENALVVLHMCYAAFHEVAQFSFLGLATLRIPIHKLEEEHAFLISERRTKANKRVEMIRAQMEEETKTVHAKAHFIASKGSIKEIAGERASLETAKQRREVVRERRMLERLWAIEDEELEPIAKERGLPTPEGAAGAPSEEKAAIIEAEFKDAVRSAAAFKAWETRRKNAMKVSINGETHETLGAVEDEGAVDNRTGTIAEKGEFSPRSYIESLAKRAESAKERRALHRLAGQAGQPWTVATDMEKVDDVDAGVVVDAGEHGRGSADRADDIGAEPKYEDGDGIAVADDDSGDNPAPDEPQDPNLITVQVTEEEPQALPAEEFDYLVATGQIDEDGVPRSQEDVEVIERPAAPDLPRLPAPEMETAK